MCLPAHVLCVLSSYNNTEALHIPPNIMSFIDRNFQYTTKHYCQHIRDNRSHCDRMSPADRALWPGCPVDDIMLLTDVPHEGGLVQAGDNGGWPLPSICLLPAVWALTSTKTHIRRHRSVGIRVFEAKTADTEQQDTWCSGQVTWGQYCNAYNILMLSYVLSASIKAMYHDFFLKWGQRVTCLDSCQCRYVSVHTDDIITVVEVLWLYLLLKTPKSKSHIQTERR